MRAWTVDADDIRVAEDFDESLLHRTPEIDAFLHPDRDDKFIVIGTKGFGKTLLLKAKRILYQREGRATCLPVGSLLDKPIGDKIFGREAVAFFAASPLPWSKAWLTAIAVAILKHSGARERSPGRAPARRPDRRRPAPRRHRSLRPPPRLHAERAPSRRHRYGWSSGAAPASGQVAGGASSSTASTSTSTSTSRALRSHPSVTGELSPTIWHFAQLGLVEVAYQLRRINHHVKVFAAIRKEAYSRLPQTTAMAQQYRGSAVDIVYSTESLREIFVNNVRLVKCDRMARPERLARRPARGVRRAAPPSTRPLHPRRGGRLRVHLPAHPAPAARPDDHRRTARRPPAGRAARTSTDSRRSCTRRRPRSPTSTWRRSRRTCRRPGAGALAAPTARARS